MIPKKLKRGDAVEIIWRDTYHEPECAWTTESEVTNTEMDILIRSVCIFLKMTNNYVYTISDMSVENDLFDSGVMRDMRIVTKAIVKMRRLK